MTQWMSIISPILIICALTNIIIQRRHLLIILLALEAIILAIIIILTTVTNTNWIIFAIIILTFGACEAGLGLACITAMSRSYGNDRLNSLSINKC